MRVIVTGFGPFLENAVNPSDALARELDGAKLGRLRTFAESPLPVVFGDAARRVLARAAKEEADAVLCLGLSARETCLRVERAAKNRATSLDADARGEVRAGRPAIEGGPETLETAIDADAFARALHERGVASAVSDDAGGYVCNDLYYRLLHAARAGEGPARVLFVHVPPKPEARASKALLEAAAITFAR
ncbi:MAG: pyroglutamyl-peptidase I [Polyangiaceae bacterium]